VLVKEGKPMVQPKTVLITGVSSYWGMRLATRLASVSELHVIGLDTTSPREGIKGLDFVQTDVRNPLLADFLREEKVDAVCHLAFVESNHRSEANFDLNVMGTMKVFGACAAAGVRKIVCRSSTAIYGARPDNPAFLSEERTPAANSRTGTVRDLMEIEAFCNGFRSQWPDIALNVLRFPSIIGPTANTPMTHFLRSKLTPTLMGFDPLMQLIHEADMVEALWHSVCHDASGVFNVAAEGVLPLSRLMALGGKSVSPPVFHLVAYWGNPLLGSVGMPVGRVWPIELDYLRYPWVGDLRKMREKLDFTPAYSAVSALREFAARRRLAHYTGDSGKSAQDEDLLRDTIERRRRARQRMVPIATQGDLELGEEDVV
jgi:UDP-glucose 4-epimerase